MAIKIAPSLLSADFGRLNEEINDITNAGADLLHLDIMDGHFVPNLTFGNPVIKSISKVAKIPLDAHLMVTNPDDYIIPYAEMGVKYFSFHIETVHHSHRMIEKIKSSKMKAGVALNPGTPVTTVIDLLQFVDFILIMSVNPGFSGQKYLNFCIDKIKFLNEYRKNNNLKYEIEIDGGVCSDNIMEITSAGCDIVVAGAYFFNKTNYSDAVAGLRGV